MNPFSEQAKSQLFTVKIDDLVPVDRLSTFNMDSVEEANLAAERSAADRRLPANGLPGSFISERVIDKKYRIIALIGQGGMGAVYRAHHLQLNKDMALKTFLSGDFDRKAWIRFQREAQAIARLNHPNVVQVFDFGVDENGLPFYTMELLQGQSLAEMLTSERALSLASVVKIFIQVSRGLSAAHAKGIIHRDIKPANLLLVSEMVAQGDPLVKIVDFGIASLHSEKRTDYPLDASPLLNAQSQSDSLLGGVQTSGGEIFGSPLYMSPEQFSGQNLTGATDIYSCGCALFEALTGAPPFFGPTAFATMNLHLNQIAPSVSSRLPDVEIPQRLEGLLSRMLAKETGRRPRSFDTVADELTAVLERLSSDDSGQQLVGRHVGVAPRVVLRSNHDETGSTFAREGSELATPIKNLVENHQLVYRTSPNGRVGAGDLSPRGFMARALSGRLPVMLLLFCLGIGIVIINCRDQLILSAPGHFLSRLVPSGGASGSRVASGAGGASGIVGVRVDSGSSLPPGLRGNGSNAASADRIASSHNQGGDAERAELRKDNESGSVLLSVDADAKLLQEADRGRMFGLEKDSPSSLAPVDENSFDVTTRAQYLNGRRAFVFPGKVSLGTLRWFENGKSVKREALGRVETDESACLVGSIALRTNSHLLNGLKPNSLTGLVFRQGRRFSDKDMAFVGRLTGLTLFQVDGGTFTSASIVELNKLQNLNILMLENCSNSAEVLWGLSRLARYKTLNVSGDKDVGRFLSKLNRPLSLEGFYARGCNLTNRDLRSLAYMPSLEVLVLNNNPGIDDAGLPMVAQLHELRLLELSGTRISRASVRSLSRLSKLTNLKIDGAMNLSDRKAIRAALPRRVNIIEE